jgi:hypothetical protein
MCTYVLLDLYTSSQVQYSNCNALMNLPVTQKLYFFYINVDKTEIYMSF